MAKAQHSPVSSHDSVATVHICLRAETSAPLFDMQVVTLKCRGLKVLVLVRLITHSNVYILGKRKRPEALVFHFLAIIFKKFYILNTNDFIFI